MKIAWIFPGQGAQKVGMAKDVYDASPAAREVFAVADEAAQFPLSELVFHGPEESLTLTANTQPAIVATSLALLAAARERYPSLPLPSFAAGHSLGEYSALAAASAIGIGDAVALVRLRGEAMQEAVPAGTGGMAAIMGGDTAAVSQLCLDAAEGAPLSPANFNCPGQVVIAGSAEAVERAVALCKERSLKAIPLKVSAPFHCAMMAPAASKVETALTELKISTPEFPVIANVDAKPNQNAEAIAALLVNQVTSTVQWEQTVRFLEEQGVTHALEIGPGKVLAGLVKKTTKSIAVHNVSDIAGIDGIADFLGL